MKERQPKSSKDAIPDHWSSAQIRRIRTALITYVETVKFFDEKGMTWLGLSEAIDEVTGTRIPAERLRQFAFGSPRTIGRDPDGRPIRYRQMSTPLPERMQAIVRYLTDEHVEALTMEDLRTPEFPASLANGLHDYLHERAGAVGDPPDKLAGLYSGRAASHLGLPAEFVRTEVSIETVASKGIFRLEETSTTIESVDGAELPLSERLYEGWAVLTPADQAIFFFRDIAEDRTHLWMLGGEADFWSERPIDKLVIHREYFPSEIVGVTDDVETLDLVVRQFPPKLLIIERVHG